MSIKGGPDIVTENLVLHLDAADKNSYPGIGDTWYDLTEKNNNAAFGTSTASPIFSNNNGGVLIFDGTNDYLNTNIISGSFIDFTIVVWFYPTSVSNYENVLDGNYNVYSPTGNIGPRLEMNNNGNLSWVISGNTTSNSIYQALNAVVSGLLPNKWYCSAFSKNGSILSTYHNGLLAYTSSNTVGFVNSFGNLLIGRGFHLGGSERWFSGNIAQVSLYNIALSDHQIFKNYNATKGRFGL